MDFLGTIALFIAWLMILTHFALYEYSSLDDSFGGAIRLAAYTVLFCFGGAAIWWPQ